MWRDGGQGDATENRGEDVSEVRDWGVKGTAGGREFRAEKTAVFWQRPQSRATSVRPSGVSEERRKPRGWVRPA